MQGLSAGFQPEMMVGGERQLRAGPYGLGSIWSPWSREHEIPPERSASVGVTRLDVEGPALQAQCHLEPRPSRLSHVLEVHPRRSGSDHAVDIVAQIGAECSEGGGEAAEWRPADARLERSRADGTKRREGRVRREAGLQADAGSRRVGAGQLEKCRRAKARRGELFMALPPGFIKTDDGRVEKDPDRRVQHTIELLFKKTLELGSGRRRPCGLSNMDSIFPSSTTTASVGKRSGVLHSAE